MGANSRFDCCREATNSLRIATLVYDVDYRHPVTLAKEIATLDLISEGRVEFGIGAGWMQKDYESAGIQLDRAGVRIERMLEAVDVLKGLWSNEPFSFTGDHYSIRDLEGTPIPCQPGGPPIIIGGGGKKSFDGSSPTGRHSGAQCLSPRGVGRS